MTDWLPQGFGYNVPTILLIGWAITDILIFIAVLPLLRKRKLLYQLIEAGRKWSETNEADKELEHLSRGLGPHLIRIPRHGS